MIKISEDGRTIFVSRGDAGTIKFSIPLSETENYEFQNGDKIQFRIFEKKGYDKGPLLEKEITVNSNTEEVDIVLTEEDTTFGPKINKATTYWYEIALNETKTTLGFDETGPAELILFPAKAGD